MADQAPKLPHPRPWLPFFPLFWESALRAEGIPLPHEFIILNRGGNTAELEQEHMKVAFIEAEESRWP